MDGPCTCTHGLREATRVILSQRVQPQMGHGLGVLGTGEGLGSDC